MKNLEEVISLSEKNLGMDSSKDNCNLELGLVKEYNTQN
jgi:hypothetical protein